MKKQPTFDDLVARYPELHQHRAMPEQGPDYPARFAIAAAVIGRGGSVAEAQQAIAVWQQQAPVRG